MTESASLRITNVDLQGNQLRREQLDCVTFAVAPVVAVVAGVLNGELLPADEPTRFAEAWNGAPSPSH